MTLGAGRVLICLPLVSACGDDTGVEIPGLDPADEVEIIEVEPDPSDDSFIWTAAYQVEGLPPVNVGHATPEFLEDAHRVGEDPEEYFCMGSGGGSGCGVAEGGRAIAGLNFGGPDVLAWSWSFIPEGAAAVVFTDQDGQTTWQRPQDGLVIFPDTMEADLDADCDCRFDAIGGDGEVITSVDLATLSYLNE